MKILVLILFVSSVAAACSNDHQGAEVSKTPEEKYDLTKDTSVYSEEMKRYWLVLLQKGPNRNQDSVSAKKIQAAHMANIIALLKKES